MNPSDTEISPFHTALAMYWRTQSGFLHSIHGPHSEKMKELWEGIRDIVFGDPRDSVYNPAYLLPDPADKNTKFEGTLTGLDSANNSKVAICEVRVSVDSVLGIIFPKASFTNSKFIRVFLHNTAFKPSIPFFDHLFESRVAMEVSRIFEQEMRAASKVGQWHGCGSAKFIAAVASFVRKGQPIRFALPAFPCKSPNSGKVGGRLPDMGERLALQTLIGFIGKVERVYGKGVNITIFTDGHVYSDCIGVDDAEVDLYFIHLKRLYELMDPSSRYKPRIEFLNLQHIFQKRRKWLLPGFGSQIQSIIHHPLQSQRTAKGDLSRELLIRSYAPSYDALWSSIRNGDPMALETYRGISRFILQDAIMPGSKPDRKAKRDAKAVAIEMIRVRIQNSCSS